MMNLLDAVGTLRLQQEAQDVVDEALTDLIKLALRYNEALRYYANKNNYLEGAPMHEDGGLLTEEDGGAFARFALGDDRPLGPAMIRLEGTEVAA